MPRKLNLFVEVDWASVTRCCICVEPTQTVADVILQALERHGLHIMDAISSVVALSSCNKPLPAHEQVGTCGLADMSSIRLHMCMNRTWPTLSETVQLLQDPLLSPKGTGQQWQGLCAGMEAVLALLKLHDPLEVLKTRDLHGYTRDQGELEYRRLQSRASVDQLVGTQLATLLADLASKPGAAAEVRAAALGWLSEMIDDCQALLTSSVLRGLRADDTSIAALLAEALAATQERGLWHELRVCAAPQASTLLDSRLHQQLVQALYTDEHSTFSEAFLETASLLELRFMLLALDSLKVADGSGALWCSNPAAALTWTERMRQHRGLLQQLQLREAQRDAACMLGLLADAVSLAGASLSLMLAIEAPLPGLSDVWPARSLVLAIETTLALEEPLVRDGRLSSRGSTLVEKMAAVVLTNTAVQMMMLNEPIDAALRLASNRAISAGIPAQVKLDLLRRRAAEEAEDAEEELGSADTIMLDREYILESAIEELLWLPPELLSDSLQLMFWGEPGMGSGVTREALLLVSSKLFNPALGLFTPASTNPRALLVSPAGRQQPEHLEYLQLAGRLVGLALLHGLPLGIHLSSALYKALACNGCPELELGDLREADEQLWRGYQVLAETPAAEVAQLGLTAVLSSDDCEGGRQEVLLIRRRGGQAAALTARNRKHFIRLAVRHLLYKRVEEEIRAFGLGLTEALHAKPADFFSLSTLNDLLGGSQAELSVAEWRQHTSVYGWHSKCSSLAAGAGSETAQAGEAAPAVVEWLWVLLESMTQVQRRTLLRFWTGYDTLPVGGFAGLPQRLQVMRADPGSCPLPRAAVCFFQLNLPDVASMEALSEGLQHALGSEQFGME